MYVYYPPQVMIWAPSFLPSVCPSVCVSVRPAVRDLSIRMDISNTNKYFFPILYTCIYYNPPMNPVKCRQDEIKNGRLIVNFVCSNWQNIWIFVQSGWISPTPMNICFRYFTKAFITILLWILWSFIRIKFKMADLSSFLFAQIDKIFENVVRPDEYL